VLIHRADLAMYQAKQAAGAVSNSSYRTRSRSSYRTRSRTKLPCTILTLRLVTNEPYPVFAERADAGAVHHLLPSWVAPHITLDSLCRSRISSAHLSADQETELKTVGLIGGMSWESTAEYYRLLNEFTRDRLGGLHSARCVLFSVDFAEIEQLQVQGRWQEAGEILAAAAQILEKAGADLLLICTNTMHKVAGQVEAAVSIPLLHLADATADAVRAAGVRKVGLLGTAFTMEQDFYRGRLEAGGLEVCVPDVENRALVHRVIYEELCLGIVKDESRKEYQRVIGNLIEAGAAGVILGCTEIELLVGAKDSPVPVFPTTRLHAETAVNAALRQEQPPFD
jgi:aspartate racemase